MRIPRSPLGSALLVGALALLGAACGGDDEGADGAPPAANGDAGRSGRGRGGPGASITLAASDIGIVRRSLLEETTPITGDLRPIETIQVRARVEGDVVAVLVREGQRVSQGDLLARFDSSEQESAQRSAEARVAAARAELATAEWNAEQSAELFRAGAIAERDHRAAQNAVTAARASVAAGDAALRAATMLVSDTRVVAPTTGTVELRSVEAGEHVARGAPLFTVVRGDVLELTASVAARRATDLMTGQPVRFVAEGRTFEGRVARVSPTIDPATRSLTVYVQVPNPGGRLKGGTFATGRVVGRTIPDALVVPTSALRQQADGGGVFVYKLDGTTIAQVDVSLGVIDEATGVAQVLAGLAEGDKVIVGNVGTLGRGMQVQVIGTPGA
jgi:RND family efflux transporter MFP subunit